jgi:DNA-directed RNA polymerase subunit RPC12/RpoP
MGRTEKSGKRTVTATTLIPPKTRGDEVPTTGEKPGVGTYRCLNCGQTVRLDDPNDTLPPCPKCDKTEFVRV